MGVVSSNFKDNSTSILQNNVPLDIIGGDFNEGDYNGGGGIAHLTANLGYVNAVTQYVPRRKETHTWPFMNNLWMLRKRLDHILWHPGPLLQQSTDRNEEGYGNLYYLKCTGCGVMTGYEGNVASDHQPVLARFAIVRENVVGDRGEIETCVTTQ